MKDLEENARQVEQVKQDVPQMDVQLCSLCSNSKEKSGLLCIKTSTSWLQYQVPDLEKNDQHLKAILGFLHSKMVK